MFDIAKDETSHQLIREFAESGKTVAAVCHGPAAFAYVKLSNGEYLVKGKKVTGFSNAEEDVVQCVRLSKMQAILLKCLCRLSGEMPFMLEDQLKSAGGNYTKAKEDWGECVVTDGNVITGQNPNSAAGVGKAILKAIRA